MSHRLFLLVLLLLRPFPAACMEPYVPEQLQPWVGWVLQGEEEERCSHSMDRSHHSCLWPGALTCQLDDSGGSFQQDWETEGPVRIFLPGGQRNWPMDVTINGEQARVVAVAERPALYLQKAGTWRIKGHFQWDGLPESLELPDGTALLHPLTVNGQQRLQPEISGNRLWLNRQDEGNGQQIEDQLHIQVFRRVEDTIPLVLTTRIELQVAGRPREVVLGWPTPDSQLPLAIDSPLPARLETDGRLRLQIRPGRFTINYQTRARGPVTALAIGQVGEPWPDQEIWSFVAHNTLRMVDIKGVQPVDPGQSNIPEEWRDLPAFRVQAGDTMELVQGKRGQPAPAPNELHLNRSMWLDFDGGGMTIQDNLQGKMSSGWRLSMAPPFILGRMTVDDRDQLITTVDQTNNAGVEVRQGALQAVAVSRLEQRGFTRNFPASGWQEQVRSLRTTLHLPPGWQLLHAGGVDRADSRLARWSLLDLFMVLVTALAGLKLLGPLRGLLLLVTLTLIYHEPGAPRFLWLLLMAVTVLTRVLPSGRARNLARWGEKATLLLLVILLVPFTIQQTRRAVYPQLEYPSLVTRNLPVAAAKAPAPAMKRSADPLPQAPAEMESYQMLDKSLMSAGSPAEPVPAPKIDIQAHDANALIQSGPGLPSWHWRQVNLNWNGPVDPGQSLQLLLLSPTGNLLLGIIQVILCWLLLLSMSGLSLPQRGKQGTVLLALLALFSGALPDTARAGDFPDQALLDGLRERLIEPPDCTPDCADFSHMNIQLEDRILRLELEAGAYHQVSLPLPASNAVIWRAVHLDDTPAPVLAADGNSWLRIPPGKHRVSMEGLVTSDLFHLVLPRRPHTVTYGENKLWRMEGLLSGAVSGPPGEQLQFERQEDTADQPTLEVGTLPPLIRVERILHLGLEWSIDTKIVRLSPPGAPVFVKIPLLDGESLTSDGLIVENGQVLCNLGATESGMEYHSAFSIRDEIVLQAPEDDRWFTTWTLDISPVWHVAVDGLAPVQHQTDAGLWQPGFHPYPGESITLRVNRPQGIAGTTKTIESSHLEIHPGLRATELSLRLMVRSTRGDQLPVTLPPESVLQQVRIGGVEQPIRMTDRQVVLPLAPVSQEILVTWRMPGGIIPVFRTPAVDLGIPSVNTEIEIKPGNRWILFTRGPRLGPAVLFYSELLVILLAALLLGRSGWTPLGVWKWLLLGLGLSQSGLVAAGLLIAWFLCLRLRQRYGNDWGAGTFNFMQIVLVVLTLAAAGGLLYAVQNGLLGHPEMLISGNNSSSQILRWYQDRAGNVLPQPLLFSVSLLGYRLVMLAWALWLAVSLIGWIKWGWGCWSSGAIWQQVRLPNRKRNNQNPAEGQKNA